MGRKYELGKLMYDEGLEEGVFKLNTSFKREHCIIKLDVLQDWIYDLTNLYNKLLTEDFEKCLETTEKNTTNTKALRSRRKTAPSATLPDAKLCETAK
jgi:hypothetical protein